MSCIVSAAKYYLPNIGMVKTFLHFAFNSHTPQFQTCCTTSSCFFLFNYKCEKCHSLSHYNAKLIILKEVEIQNHTKPKGVGLRVGGGAGGVGGAWGGENGDKRT